MGLGEGARAAFLASITGNARSFVLSDSIECSCKLEFILFIHVELTPS